MMRSPRSRAGAVALARWAMFAPLYLAFAGRSGAEELIAAAACGAGAVAFATRLSAIATSRLRLPRGWSRLLPGAAHSLVVETARVAATLMRSAPPCPGVVRQPVASRRPRAAETACRGAIGIALSVAPNGFVLAAGRRHMPLHRLDATQPASAEREWPP